MTETELISLFSQFGYLVIRFGTTFSIFDRRICRRIADVSLEELRNYAENIFSFSYLTEILEKAVEAFSDIHSQKQLEPTIVEAEPEAHEDQDEVEHFEPEQEPEQEQESAPALPVIDSKTGDQDSDQGETEPATIPEKIPPVLYTKTCKGCGKEFQTAHKQSMYCSPACYPSSKSKQGQSEEFPEKPVAVMQRPF